MAQDMRRQKRYFRCGWRGGAFSSHLNFSQSRRPSFSHLLEAPEANWRRDQTRHRRARADREHQRSGRQASCMLVGRKETEYHEHGLQIRMLQRQFFVAA